VDGYTKRWGMRLRGMTRLEKAIAYFENAIRESLETVNYPTLYRVELVKAQVDYPKSFEDYVI